MLSFHPEKCVTMRIGTHANLEPVNYIMNDNVLQTVSEEKDLGIYIDNKLTFDHHICEKVAKATSMVNLIRRSFQFLDKDSFKLLFCAIVSLTLNMAMQCGVHTLKSILLQ